jgi:GNAT superfamily N-acetyltransferase
MASETRPSSKRAKAPKLVVRKARALDRDAILAMSRGIWGGSDYLPLVWDRWLADDKGLLLTATLDGTPVGMSKITILSPGEIWLEGLRLHPSLQGRGLTRQLNEVAFREVAKLRPKSVRYSTGAGNVISRHLGERRGFWQVARARWMWGGARRNGPIRGRVAELRELPALMAFVRGSDCYRSMSGLFAIGWKFPELTRRLLRELLSRERVLVSPRRGEIRGVAIYEIGEIDRDVCLGYIDGPRETIASLARDVLRVAGMIGHKEASAMLPAGPIADTVRTAGFDRNHPVEAVVYEMGARGLSGDAEPLDSILRRTLRMNEEEATDLMAGFLTERAPVRLAPQNVRDFVARNLIPDTRREVLGALRTLNHGLANWSLRGVFSGIIERLVLGHGLGAESMAVRKGAVSFRHRGRRIADVSTARRSITLKLGPGFGACFPARLGSCREWVTLPPESFDRASGRYSAVIMRLTSPSQLDDALKAIDAIMKSAKLAG